MTQKIAFIGLACALSISCTGDINANLSADASVPDAPLPPPPIDARPIDAPPIDAPPIDAPPIDAPTDPLILSYSFEDTAGTVVTDSSPRHKDGTASKASLFTTDGRVGHGVTFSALRTDDDNVSLPNGVFTDVSDFTVAFWVKLNSQQANAHIYDLGNLAGGRWMWLSANGFLGNPPTPPMPPAISVSSFLGGTEIVVNTHTAIPTGVWKHMAVTGSGGDRTLYIDGYPAFKVSTALNVPPSAMEPLSPESFIGKSRFNGDPGLDGTVDEFRIYNKVLAQPDIADLAYPKKDYSYWRFDEGTGFTAKDSSDNDIPTTLASNITWAAGQLGSSVVIPGGPSTDPFGHPAIKLAKSPFADCDQEATVSVWFKINTAVPFAHVFDFGNGVGNGSSFFYLAPAFAGTNLHVALASPNGPPTDIGSSPSIDADGKFHHVAVTVKGADVHMFKDGVEVDHGTLNGTIRIADFKTGADNFLGTSRFNGDQFLNGAIDELRIGCRALTADEIKNLANP